MSASRGTILIVDDEPSQRDWTRRALDQEAYTVVLAANANEALAAQQRHRGEIGLLLIDLVLPERNGYELGKALRQREPHLKMLFVSGQTGGELRKFLEAPLPDIYFLLKPFGPKELLKRVKLVFESEDPLADAASR